MRTLTFSLLLMSHMLVGCTPPATTPTERGPALSQQDLKTWMEFLAGDALRGRASGSPEVLMAAGYLAAQMEAVGLTPLPGHNSYFHEFTFERGGTTYTEYNVVGYLEGANPKKKAEYILIGGHYDHVGVGAAVEGDSIYNGADDDASGTITMLGLAKMLAAGERPARSIVFAAWAAEEMGLMGSKAFAANPPIALENMAVNVNLEMTGHAEQLGEGKVFMTGPQYSNLNTQISETLASNGFELIDDPFAAQNLFYRSDNASFISLKKEGDVNFGIPAHTLCTWGGEDHYHRPHDDPSTVNYANMHKLVLALTPAIAKLANEAERTEWTSEDFARYTGTE